VLACALDLHPGFEAVPDADALARRAPARRRPVLAGPTVTADALRLAERRPDAKIVCVERDMASTIRSIRARPDAHGDFYSEQSARAATVEFNRACELLAVALGPGRVLRIGLLELVDDPEATLAACSRFLGEELAEVSALPLAALRVEARNPELADAAVTRDEARRRLRSSHPVTPASLGARLRQLVAGLVDDDAVVAVISRGDEVLLDLGGGRARHFPATEDGSFAGEYPATGAAAVELLEAARAQGVTHLLVPAPASWWLTHYRELRAHLDRRYRTVAGAEATGTLYDLRVTVGAVR
jgi:Sulfotransferase family